LNGCVDRINTQSMERYPEKSELVVATVERVTAYGAYVRLDEYEDKQGIVNIRDFSFKWVKHPRDYLKEGQKAVLKVVRVNRDRGHIDLSLKNVSDAERKEKLKRFKLEGRMEKLMELLAKSLKTTSEKLYSSFADKLADDYDSLYDAFVTVSAGKEDLKSYIKDEKMRTEVLKMIKENIKPPRVEIYGTLNISSDAPDGLGRIKAALMSGESMFKDGVEGSISYLSSPRYSISVSAEDYKTAEKHMKAAVDAIEAYSNSNGLSFEFAREKK